MPLNLCVSVRLPGRYDHTQGKEFAFESETNFKWAKKVLFKP